jgi:hypothetical protein
VNAWSRELALEAENIVPVEKNIPDVELGSSCNGRDKVSDRVTKTSKVGDIEALLMGRRRRPSGKQP